MKSAERGEVTLPRPVSRDCPAHKGRSHSAAMILKPIPARSDYPFDPDNPDFVVPVRLDDGSLDPPDVVSPVSYEATGLPAGASFDADTCRERLKADLSAYKIPRQVFLCEKGELPFTDSGKIDKRRLAAILAERPAS